MGIKRWLLALIILVVVLGFIGFFFLQSGADKKLTEDLIPKIEERFGVTVAYDSLTVSLSSVSFKNVVLRPVDGKKPFARIGRLGVNVRVGPLLLGELDITGLRVDDLELLVGNRAGGATVDEWRQLKERLAGDGTEGEGGGRSIPEIYVVSGGLSFKYRLFSAQVGGLEGRITPGNKAVLQVEEWQCKGGDAAVEGEDLLVEYDFESRHLEVEQEQPSFAFPLAAKKRQLILQAASDTLADLGLRRDGTSGADEPLDTHRYLDAIVKITDAKGELRSQDAGSIAFSRVNADFITNAKQLFSARANGDMEGASARWALVAGVPRKGDPTLSLEIPDVSLAQLGPMFLPGEVVDWSRANLGGQVQVLRTNEDLVFEGQATLTGLAISHPRLGGEPISNLSGQFDFHLSHKGADQLLHVERLVLNRERVRLTVRGDIRTDRLAYDLRFTVSPTACRQVLSAIPAPLRRDLDGVGLEGRIGVDIHMALDLIDPDSLVLDATLDNQCKISDWGPVPHPDTFRRPFAWMAYDEDGDRMRVTSGPGTTTWTSLPSISPYLISAVLTTEDGKFERHRGMTLPELRTAMVMNLKKGGLHHGASTVTMQLAKNLFLSRDRTIKRKLEELFYTWYLESNFTKDEILELYFNVVEFGPSLYGVGPATIHYFGREPYELNLAEAVFLIKLLPNPVARYQSYVNGKLSERKMASLHRVMETLKKRKRISEGEYRLGLDQEVVFYKEGEPLPEPRNILKRDGNPVDLSIPPDLDAEEIDTDGDMVDEGWE